MKRIFTFIVLLISTLSVNAQQDGNIPKDALVKVVIMNPKGKLLPNELVVFRSTVTSKEYQGLSDSTGKFSIRLPHSDKYNIYVLGFSDSTLENVLNIPTPPGKAYYRDNNPFNVEIEFTPAKSFVLDHCTFETGKAILLPEAFTVLNELVEYLERKDDERIELGGHTDNVGGAAKNMKLSLDRALAVRQYLISKGIAENRLVAKGYGLTKPIASNKSAAGRAQNRRTEVKIL